MTTFPFLIQQNCHLSWDSLFTNQNVLNDLAQISLNIANQLIEPQPNNIFRAFQTDLNNCKVVILGQDPYPQPTVATGRAFEVGNITNWMALRTAQHSNASLRNILKLLHKNRQNHQSIQSINVVMNDPIFMNLILPPNQIFNNWERQGVLLLNTALTCPQGNTSQSNAHAKNWKNFTEEAIKFIDTNINGVSWFLWGKGRGFCHLISNGTKYCSEHPRNNNNGPGSFYYENHFSKVTLIRWV